MLLMNRKAQTFVLIAAAMVCSGGSVDAQQASAAQTVRFASYSRIQQLGRWCGWGWGDGYHACHNSSCRPLADLPPRAFSEKNRPSQASAHQRLHYPSSWTGSAPIMSSVPPMRQTFMTSPFDSDVGFFESPLTSSRRALQSELSKSREKADSTDSSESHQGDAYEEQEGSKERSTPEDLPTPQETLDLLDARAKLDIHVDRATRQRLAAARLPQPSKQQGQEMVRQHDRPTPKRLPSTTPLSLRSARLAQ